MRDEHNIKNLLHGTPIFKLITNRLHLLIEIRKQQKFHNKKVNIIYNENNEN